jgi:CIC family chloride channel protein
MESEEVGESTLRGAAERTLNTSLSRARSLARRFLVLTLALVGALCGVIAVVFERYVEMAREMMIGVALDLHGPLRIVLVVAIPTIVFPLIAIAIRKFASRAVGANLARVRMAYNDDPALLSRRSIAATFIATPLSLGAGAPLGPEGPIVVVTSGISAAIGRALRLPRKLVRGMIPVGVAAGIAAVFNTPITGVVFALEEVFGSADRGLLGGVLVGAVAAAVVEKSLLGGKPLLAAPSSAWSDPRELIGFALVGVIAGLASGASIAVAHRLKRQWAARVPSEAVRAAMAGLAVGVAGLFAPSILGVGYDSVSFWLHGGGTARGTALAFAIKTITFVIAISAGVLGGSFAPSLFIGTALGAAIGHGAQNLFPAAGIDPKAYAIVGMGASFAGLLRSPIAAVLIAIELTSDYALVVPLMLAVSLAIAVSRRISRISIVEQQMIDEGYIESAHEGDPLAGLRAAEAMSAAPMVMQEEATLADAHRLRSSSAHRLYAVVNTDNRIVGVLRRDVLDSEMSSGRGNARVREVMEEPKLVATGGEDIRAVVRRMQLLGVDRCPVVDSDAARHVIGFISPSDILRARIARSRGEEDVEFNLFE